ncbi:MAG TPA: asparaginase [Thermoanaerobaculia bacterium]|nr:asparaginase [Thermoanaerobaculia bacterium]
MATVQIITTGGTIASRIDPSTGGAVPAVGAGELVALSPAIRSYASAVRVTDFGMLQSWNIGPEVMRQIAVTASNALRDDAVAGVVVTHGTDTMEETAFALDLLVESPKAVVFTGAMRNASDPGFDGPRNLAAAVRVAVDPSSRGRGTLVAMNDEIHAARFVTKTHTTSFSTFASPETGPIGIIDDRGVWYRSTVEPRPHIVCSKAEDDVHLVKSAAGADALILNALFRARVAGVVLEGSGAGNVPNVWQEPIAALIAASIPVVLVSRCMNGRIVPVYGGPGGGRTLHDLGVIDGGWLSGPKARVALSFALGAGMNGGVIRSFFAELSR